MIVPGAHFCPGFVPCVFLIVACVNSKPFIKVQYSSDLSFRVFSEILGRFNSLFSDMIVHVVWTIFL